MIPASFLAIIVSENLSPKMSGQLPEFIQALHQLFVFPDAAGRHDIAGDGSKRK